jgi:hypothetical protein
VLLYSPQIAWLASVVVNEKNAMRCVLTPSRLTESGSSRSSFDCGPKNTLPELQTL